MITTLQIWAIGGSSGALLLIMLIAIGVRLTRSKHRDQLSRINLAGERSLTRFPANHLGPAAAEIQAARIPNVLHRNIRRSPYGKGKASAASKEKLMRNPSLDEERSARSIQQLEHVPQPPRWPIPKTLTGSGHVSRKSSGQTLKISPKLSTIVERQSTRSSGIPPVPIRPSTPETPSKVRQVNATPETVKRIQSSPREPHSPHAQCVSPLASKRTRTTSISNPNAVESDRPVSPLSIRDVYHDQKSSSVKRQRSMSLHSQKPGAPPTQQLPSPNSQLPPLDRTGHLRNKSLQLSRHESTNSTSSCNTSILGDADSFANVLSSFHSSHQNAVASEPTRDRSSPGDAGLRWQFSEDDGFSHQDGHSPSRGSQIRDESRETIGRFQHRRKESEISNPSPPPSESNRERYRRNSNYITKLADSARASPEKWNHRLPMQPSPPVGKVYDDMKHYLSATASGSPEPKPSSPSTLQEASGNAMGPLSSIGEKRRAGGDETSLPAGLSTRSNHQRSNTINDATHTLQSTNQQVAPVAVMSSANGSPTKSSTPSPPVFSALGLVFESQEADAAGSSTSAPPTFTLPPEPLHLTSPTSPPTPSRNPALHRRSLKAQHPPPPPPPPPPLYPPSPSFHTGASDAAMDAWPLKPFIPPSTASKPTPISSHVGPISPGRLSLYIGPVSPSTALSSRWARTALATAVRVPRGPRTQPTNDATAPQRPPHGLRSHPPSQRSSPLKHSVRSTPSPLPVPDQLSPEHGPAIPSIVAPDGDGDDGDMQSAVRNLRRMNSMAESDGGGAESQFLKLGRKSFVPSDDAFTSTASANTNNDNTLTPTYSHARIRKAHLRAPTLGSVFRNLSAESVVDRRRAGDEASDSGSDSDVSPKTQVERAFERRALAEREEVDRARSMVRAREGEEEEEGEGKEGVGGSREDWFGGGDGVHFMVPRGMGGGGGGGGEGCEGEDGGRGMRMGMAGDGEGFGMYGEGWGVLGTPTGSLYDGTGFLRESPGVGRRVGVGD